MLNFFRRIQPQSPVLRNNYFVQVDDKLAWSESIGPEDSEGIGWFTAEKNKAIEHHWFRSERQSLRRYVEFESTLCCRGLEYCGFVTVGSVSMIDGSFWWMAAPLLDLTSRSIILFSMLTLRDRLPRSGGVVFTIRTYFHPVVDICKESYVPGRLASAVRSWGDDVSKYKGRERYGDVLLEYLDKMHEEQVKNGLDLSREDEVRAYPY
jgi:alpha-1,2-mannosyltransferase